MKSAAVKIGAVFVAVSMAAAIGYGLFRWHTLRRVSSVVDQIAESVPGVAAIDVGRIRSGPFGRRIELEAVSIRFTSGRRPIRIDSVRISDTDYSHPVPRRMHLVVSGARLHPSHVPQLFSLLPGGVVSGPLVLRLEVVYRYRDDLQQLDLQQFLLTAERLGELSLAGRFDNLNLERMFQPPIQPVAVFGALTGAGPGAVGRRRPDTPEIWWNTFVSGGRGSREGFLPERFSPCGDF
jgi:hypothetical protein